MHIIEITEIRPPVLLPYEKMKVEITTSLLVFGRKQAVDQYQHPLQLLNHEKEAIYR
jgi:hypothetical protein